MANLQKSVHVGMLAIFKSIFVGVVTGVARHILKNKGTILHFSFLLGCYYQGYIFLMGYPFKALNKICTFCTFPGTYQQLTIPVSSFHCNWEGVIK